MFTRISTSSKKIVLAATAVVAMALPAVSMAEQPLQPQHWAVELHGTIPAQGNAALEAIQFELRKEAGELDAEFLPPQILGLQKKRRDDTSAS